MDLVVRRELAEGRPLARAEPRPSHPVPTIEEETMKTPKTKKTSAKKPAAKARPSDGAPKSSTKAMAIPTDGDVISAVKSLAQMQKASRSAAGEVGAKVADLATKKHFNPKALRAVLSARDMPDEKFAIFWTHLGVYAKALGFDERAKLAQTMFAEADEDDAKNAARDLGTPAGESDVRPRHLRSVEGGASERTGTDG